ncbi:hypothetical protein CH063_09443 [Colletotrichum higginsianum]|nr:hypothetical protein CH063_09443 [Colletotrichum higginsianum]
MSGSNASATLYSPIRPITYMLVSPYARLYCHSSSQKSNRRDTASYASGKAQIMAIEIFATGWSAVVRHGYSNYVVRLTLE